LEVRRAGGHALPRARRGLLRPQGDQDEHESAAPQLTARMDQDAAARAIDAFLRALGRDPEHEPELAGTGARVARAFAEELLEGYTVDVDALLVHNVLAGGTEVVVARDLPVATTCPHHLMPAIGTATVAFAPE